MYKVLLITLFTSCSTITFINTESSRPLSQAKNNWHHVGILGFAEISDPFSPQMFCKNTNWGKITVEQRAPQVITSLLPYLSAWYRPWNVKIECLK